MKLPYILTSVILAAGIFFGIQEARALSVLRKKHRMVAREAAVFGIAENTSESDSRTKTARRQARDSARKVKDLSNAMAAVASDLMKKRTADLDSSGRIAIDHTQPDMVAEKRLMDGILSLRGQEFKSFIDEMRARTDMDATIRNELIAFAIGVMAEKNPQAALSTLTDPADFQEHADALSGSLQYLAKEQPLAALEWIKKNANNLPADLLKRAKSDAVTGSAQTDFGLAFQLASEFKLFSSKNSTISTLAYMAQTPERKTEFLTALRKQLINLTDPEDEKNLLNGLGRLFQGTTRQGYDTTMAWIKNADLSPAETDQLIGNIKVYKNWAESEKWLDWISYQNTDEKISGKTSSELMQQWTKNDYQAAGKWLVQAPPGPIKENATMSYIETVAPYDPDVATQWAQTLPEHKRAEALNQIQRQIQLKEEQAQDFGNVRSIRIE